MEKRISNFTIEKREGSNSPGTLVGYASTTEVVYDVGWFQEKIARGAFGSVLQDDVRALFNHDPNQILGRSVSGTLRLSEDEKGLRYEIDLPDTQFGRDFAESVRRKDITQSSFAFSVEEETWVISKDKNKKDLRTITKIKKLHDVSPVTYPANPDTSVAKRGRDNASSKKKILELRLKLLEIEND